MPSVPAAVRTARLLLRSWAADDAGALAPILEANRLHLGPWIPPRVAAPAPLPVLAARLAAYDADFVSGRGFRFAIVTRADGRLVGEADLFPRNAGGRVPLVDADRAELGDGLDAAATGRGYATEAARALLDVARELPGIGRAEIRCEAANITSVGVARRLEFAPGAVVADDGAAGAPPVPLQVWTLVLRGQRSGAADSRLL